MKLKGTHQDYTGSLLTAIALCSMVCSVNAIVNFDDVPSDTVINTHYPGLTFAKSGGGDVYARSDYYAPSAPNVVTIMEPSSGSWFNEDYGTVLVTFATPATSVSVVATPWIMPENVPPYRRRPYMRVYNTSGGVITTIYYSKSLPNGGSETLIYNPGSATIGKIALSCEAPAGDAPIYATFDNLQYANLGTYQLHCQSSGGGSVTMDPALTGYPSGTQVTMTASPAAGWLFAGWTGDITSAANPLELEITSDLNLSANFIPHGVNVVNFDVPGDATVINNYYPGLVFTNAIGGNAYARSSVNAPSAPNIASIFQTGLPEFNAYWGAVDVYLSVPVRSVSIDVRPELPPEALSPATKKPFLQTFNSAGTLLSTVYYAGALPTNPGQIGQVETLSYNSAQTSISRVRFSVQNPSGSTPTYGLFDNFTYDAGVYALSRTIVGGGSIVATPEAAAYSYGTTVTLKAVPAVGWLFSNWSGAATGNANPVSLPALVADAAVTATFTSCVPSIIVDNPAATFSPSITLVWTNVTLSAAYNGNCRVTAAEVNENVYAIYHPNIPRAGKYDIAITYPDTQGYGTDYGAVEVHRLFQMDFTIGIDQSVGGYPPTRWKTIATNTQLSQGTWDYLKLRTSRNQLGRVLVADAFRFSWATNQVTPALVVNGCLPGFGKMTISWDSIPGRVYQLQYKNALTDSQWTTLPGDVTAGGWTASKEDTSISGRSTRFYQVVMLPP